jgi:mono/diheme cytochrome c family protein
MRPTTTSLLALSLLIIGIVAVTLILILLGRIKATQHPGYFRWAHRISGYIFIILYLFICVTMFQKLTGNSSALSAKDAIHAYLGIVIFPMLIVKICIVRLFKKYYLRLPIYGIIIMVAVFMTVTLSAGYFMLSTVSSQYIVLSDKGRLVRVNVNIGRKIVQQKCSTCHSLERVFSYVKTEADWRDYVSRMREKDPAILDDTECLQTVGYLVKTLGIDESKMDVQVGMKIILEKCHKCHTLERVFTFKKTQAEWVQTIELMRSFDPYLLNDSEMRQVNYYLSKILAKQKTES